MFFLLEKKINADKANGYYPLTFPDTHSWPYEQPSSSELILNKGLALNSKTLLEIYKVCALLFFVAFCTRVKRRDRKRREGRRIKGIKKQK